MCLANDGVILNRWRGFTLFEMIICLAIVAILCVVTVAMNQSFYQRNKLDIVQNELINALSYARNMAIIKGRPLTLAPLSESSPWADGMILFIANPSHHYLKQEDIIYHWRWHYPGISILWKGFQSTRYLTFASALKHASCNGSFVIGSNYGGSKKIIINRLGRIRQ